jgi:hypothetical protein
MRSFMARHHSENELELQAEASEIEDFSDSDTYASHAAHVHVSEGAVASSVHAGTTDASKISSTAEGVDQEVSAGKTVFQMNTSSSKEMAVALEELGFVVDEIGRQNDARRDLSLPRHVEAAEAAVLRRSSDFLCRTAVGHDAELGRKRGCELEADVASQDAWRVSKAAHEISRVSATPPPPRTALTPRDTPELEPIGRAIEEGHRILAKDIAPAPKARAYEAVPGSPFDKPPGQCQGCFGCW